MFDNRFSADWSSPQIQRLSLFVWEQAGCAVLLMLMVVPQSL